jgi:GT2 family glycosyltransferase
MRGPCRPQATWTSRPDAVLRRREDRRRRALELTSPLLSHTTESAREPAGERRSTTRFTTPHRRAKLLSMDRIGCVVIGRNEAQRLERCIVAARKECQRIVYVDSASTDDSVEIARSLDVEVLTLDGSQRLSAARGRNAGFAYLDRTTPGLEYVQFIDGDSELSTGWLAAGEAELDREKDAAAVCGRILERRPHDSVYNAVNQMEWTFDAGDVEWCAGTALFRAKPFREANGFDPTLIAGEEPDLCARLRAQGLKFRALDQNMAVHDADMTRFSQWWTRNVRTGHAYAEAITRRPNDPAMHAAASVRSITTWGLALPGLSLLLAPPTLGLSLLAPMAGYPTLLFRVYRTMRKRGFSAEDSRLYAAFCVLGKFPQAWGLVRYRALRMKGRASDLIEYKNPT